MMRKLVPYVITLSVSSVALGAYTIDSSQVLKVEIANKGLTRLSVEKDKIQDFFVFPEMPEDDLTLHESGNMFITGERLASTLYLTVITSKGETQDLEIKTTNKPASPVLLKMPLKEQPVSEQEISSWLSDFEKGFIPASFKGIPCEEKPRQTNLFKAFPFKSWKNKSHKVTLYSISSLIDEPLRIDAERITKSGEASLLTYPDLKPGEQAYLYIISKVNN
jgi:hypothetical protein